ncbi:hypothetical protein D210916BOD24_05440 [Alteromonas sp. D210916BOD_24]
MAIHTPTAAVDQAMGFKESGEGMSSMTKKATGPNTVPIFWYVGRFDSPVGDDESIETE